MPGRNQSRPGGGSGGVRQQNRSAVQNNPKATPVKPDERPSLVDEIDSLLGGMWPLHLRHLFDPQNPRPLRCGIREEIACACCLDEGERRQLGKLLGKWVGRTSYLRALSAPGAQRYGLDGAPAEAVSPEHQAAALEQMERSQLKRARRQSKQRAKVGACKANAARPTLRLGSRP